ncbi:alpha/beta-hydrolase [Lichtheimia hyalospora FSU 10163]|nr:alpha/beta-hydrolase [Lichtheimia hyalospora FSU 10163]
MLKSFVGFTLLAVATVSAKILEPHDVVTLPRPGGVLASPNGRMAVYGESVYHADNDKTTRSLYLLDLESTLVSALTAPSFDEAQSDPFFLDDDHVAFIQHNPDEPVDQLYAININNGDQKPYKLTNFPIEFGNIKYNADQRLLAFTAMVYEDASTLEGTKERDEQLKETKKDSGIAYDQLMVRHWDKFVPEKKSNIFVVSLDLQDGQFKLAQEPRNILAGSGLECPQFGVGDSSEYDISPDGQEVAFLSKIQGPSNAWESSKHLYVVSTSGQVKPFVINSDIPAATSGPKYSPSGLLGYLQMYKPQYESDRNRITIYDRHSGTRTVIAEQWDRSPSELVFSADSTHVYVVAAEYGREKIFSIDLITHVVEPLTEKHSASGLSLLGNDTLLFTINSMQFPNVVHSLDISTGKLQRYGPAPSLGDALNGIEMAKPEEFDFTGALGDRVHGWMIKPVDFDPAKKYPVAFLIHGGPQGAWEDNWSTRWNPQVFAGAGYVAILINPHGSTGYGQEFTDSIQHHWGSHPYHDLEKGLDYLLETYEFLDADRIAGLGASYGGYMINWLNGHSDRFKALVNHDGVFSTVQTFYTTEELYFVEHEFGGVPYHPLSRIIYERWSPSNFVQYWKTPTLVIHGIII